MASENTGYQAYRKLLKVVDGGPHNGEPLDINNSLCSVSGLPQDSKDNNTGDPNYIDPVLNTEDCPIPL